MRAEQSWVLFQWPDRYSGDVIHNHTAYPWLSTSLFYRVTCTANQLARTSMPGILKNQAALCLQAFLSEKLNWKSATQGFKVPRSKGDKCSIANSRPTVLAQCQQEGRASYPGASRRSTSSSPPTGRPQRAGCTAGKGELVRLRGAGSPPTAPCPPRPPSQPTFAISRFINVWKRLLLSLSCWCSQRSCRPIDSMACVALCPALHPPEPVHRSDVAPRALIGSFKSIYATDPARVSGRRSQGALPVETRRGGTRGRVRRSGWNMRITSCGTPASPRGFWVSCLSRLLPGSTNFPALGKAWGKPDPNNGPERSLESQCSKTRRV